MNVLSLKSVGHRSYNPPKKMKNMWVIMEYDKIEMKDAFLFRATSCTGNLRYWKLLVMLKLCEKPVGTAPVSEKKKSVILDAFSAAIC